MSFSKESVCFLPLISSKSAPHILKLHRHSEKEREAPWTWGQTRKRNQKNTGLCNRAVATPRTVLAPWFNSDQWKDAPISNPWLPFILQFTGAQIPVPILCETIPWLWLSIFKIKESDMEAKAVRFLSHQLESEHKNTKTIVNLKIVIIVANTYWAFPMCPVLC